MRDRKQIEKETKMAERKYKAKVRGFVDLEADIHSWMKIDLPDVFRHEFSKNEYINDRIGAAVVKFIMEMKSIKNCINIAPGTKRDLYRVLANRETIFDEYVPVRPLFVKYKKIFIESAKEAEKELMRKRIAELEVDENVIIDYDL